MRFRKYFKILAIAAIVMGITLLRLWSFSGETCSYDAEAYRGLQLSKLEQLLETTGLIGRIHGIGDDHLFVLSVRDPDSFFRHQELALLPDQEQTSRDLNQFHRHDQVCIQGKILKNPSAQIHVKTHSVTLLESWDGLRDFSQETLENSPEASEPSALLDFAEQGVLIGKIHAIGDEGRILVLDSGDKVFPVFLKGNAETAEIQDLYRGDIVRLAYQVQSRPEQPPHLNFSASDPKPLQVLDHLKDLHQTVQTLTGKLVKFPQSPQLKFDVYALSVETPVSYQNKTEKIDRIFTLVNFENMDNFMAIQDQLSQIWEQSIDTAQKARNGLVNPEVTLQVTGQVNITSPEQANPQLVLKGVEDLQVVVNQ
ncbi:MAG: hypothetical protein ACO37W_03380 [Prochlorotrichaceae cyanobacterium]